MEAVPEPGYRFAGWSGGAEVANIISNLIKNPVSMLTTGAMDITANFEPRNHDFTSDDGIISIIIPESTIARDGSDSPLTDIEFSVAEDPPSPPDDIMIIQAYDLGPNGSTFEPPISLVWSYNSSDILDGISEKDLSVGYYDKDDEEWLILESEVNASDNIITASIEHFSTFALLAPYMLESDNTPPPPELSFTTSSLSIYPPGMITPGSQVTITILITNANEVETSKTINLKINEEIEQSQDITLESSESRWLTFNTFRNESGTYTVNINGLTDSFTVTSTLPVPPSLHGTSDPPPLTLDDPHPPIPTATNDVNWKILGPLLVAVFIAIFLPMKLRRRRGPLDW